MCLMHIIQTYCDIGILCRGLVYVCSFDLTTFVLCISLKNSLHPAVCSVLLFLSFYRNEHVLGDLRPQEQRTQALLVLQLTLI